MTCFGSILMSALSKLFIIADVAVTDAFANRPSSDLFFNNYAQVCDVCELVHSS